MSKNIRKFIAWEIAGVVVALIYSLLVQEPSTFIYFMLGWTVAELGKLWWRIRRDRRNERIRSEA